MTLTLGMKVFATTMATSRWKSLEQVNEAGKYAESEVPGTLFWDRNWRKGGLSDRRNEICRERNFYMQSYCGCEFSKTASEARAASDARTSVSLPSSVSAMRSDFTPSTDGEITNSERGSSM